MAEEASESTNSASTIKSGSITRRNSLPLFPSDLGKNVPGYLRASTGSCHDHCKYGRREMCDVTPKRPANKRPVAARGLKASDKPHLGQNDPSRIRKPQILHSNKTPDASSKQSMQRAKDSIAKSSESFPKPVKSKLLRENSLTRKSDATPGDEKLKREREIVPGSGNLRDAKSNEGRNLTKSANGLSTGPAVKLNAKAKPSPSPAPLKTVARIKPLSSSSPPRVRPVMKARLQSSPSKLKPASLRVISSSSPSKSRPVSLRVKSSSSPSKSRPVRLKVNASSSPTKLKPVSLRAKSSSSPIKLKPVSLKVNSLSSPGSFKLKHATAKTSPPSISPRNLSSKKSIIIRSQMVKTGESSEVHASETVATQRGSASLDFEDAANSEKKELQQENLVEAQIDENKELLQENLVEDQIDEKKEVFKESEEDSRHEFELQNQEEVSESYDDQASEKTLYVIKSETGNNTEPAPNAEDEITDTQPLASVSPPQSPSSPISVTESNTTTELEASIMELTNTDTAVPCVDQETPDIEPLPSLSQEISAETHSSLVVSNEASLYEVSLDGSVYTDSEEGYSSNEDEHLVEGENLKGDVETIKVKKKSVIVTSQENGKDPVKLKFRRGRVIDMADENHGPRRLKFRRARVLDEKAVNDLIRRRSFKNTDATQVDVTTENNSGSVVLRHQDMQDKKDAKVLINNVIEETASKLVEKRKSMVKALVGAFETVISLQDGKPATTQEDQ